jgi:hypothetical protein
MSANNRFGHYGLDLISPEGASHAFMRMRLYVFVHVHVLPMTTRNDLRVFLRFQHP